VLDHAAFGDDVAEGGVVEHEASSIATVAAHAARARFAIVSAAGPRIGR